MIKSNGSITEIKQQIKSLQNKNVEVTLNLGRNKFIRFFGMVKEVYPALFTVLPFDKDFKGKTSYSYSEYMCGRVKLSKPQSTAE